MMDSICLGHITWHFDRSVVFLHIDWLNIDPFTCQKVLYLLELKPGVFYVSVFLNGSSILDYCNCAYSLPWWIDCKTRWSFAIDWRWNVGDKYFVFLRCCYFNIVELRMFCMSIQNLYPWTYHIVLLIVLHVEDLILLIDWCTLSLLFLLLFFFFLLQIIEFLVFWKFDSSSPKWYLKMQDNT